MITAPPGDQGPRTGDQAPPQSWSENAWRLHPATHLTTEVVIAFFAEPYRPLLASAAIRCNTKYRVSTGKVLRHVPHATGNTRYGCAVRRTTIGRCSRVICSVGNSDVGFGSQPRRSLIQPADVARYPRVQQAARGRRTPAPVLPGK